MLFNKNMISEAKESFLNLYSGKLEAGVILGSGLSQAQGDFKVIKEIHFSEIKNLKTSNVEGHKNKFLIVKSGKKDILIMQGRIHLYEGYSAFEASLPVALMGELGIKNLILTNAAGGINRDFRVGDIMEITDHINLQPENPLRGIIDSSKFVNMADAYDQEYLNELNKEFDVKPGVYVSVPGPNYETPAEINFFRIIGADAVGMSIVMEAIMAKYYKMRLFGFSLITNMAAGMQKMLSHDEVIESGKKSGLKLLEIIKFIIRNV